MRKVSLILALLTALLAVPGRTMAQNVPSLASARASIRYAMVKKAIADFMTTSKMDVYSQHEDKLIDLYYCSDYSDLGLPVGKEDHELSRLSAVAFDSIVYETILSAAGYPRSLWADFLNARERAGLAGQDLRAHHDGKRTLLVLAAKLNEYRSHGHAGLPAAKVEGGCGAGGTSVAFDTSPPGGRVLLVPKMYYSLCRLQGLDPDDDRRCGFWQEVFPGQSPEISGEYFAKIIWPDHSVIRSFSAAKLSYDASRVTLQ